MCSLSVTNTNSSWQPQYQAAKLSQANLINLNVFYLLKSVLEDEEQGNRPHGGKIQYMNKRKQDSRIFTCNES